LLRDGPSGLETFMVRRHARSPAFPSAYVFPGGTVRDDDMSVEVPDFTELGSRLSDRSDVPVDARLAAAYYVCAIRELFEEAGVFLVRGLEGRLLRVGESDTTLEERLESTRLALQARNLSISDVLNDGGWQLAFDLLVPFSHWVTPRLMAARFDTRFFVAEMPRGQSALHDTIETSEGVWLSPARALDDEYHTVYATAQHLRRLAPYQSVDELMRFARSKRIRCVSPEVVEHGSGLNVFIPPDVANDW
jgi:8-oxo-dGTP pyrophosphatase MutT (NUDIX family)